MSERFLSLETIYAFSIQQAHIWSKKELAALIAVNSLGFKT